MKARRFAAAAVSLAFLPAAGPQDPAGQRLVLQTPEMAEVRVEKDRAYYTRDDAELRFDLYRPKADAPDGPLPAVLLMNGSGPALKDWAQYEDWGRLCATAGLVGITFQARRDRATDFDDLLIHLEEQAEELGIDLQRLGLFACSANGRAVTPWAMDPERGRLRCAVFYYALMPFESVRADLPLLVVRAGQDDAVINDSIDRFAAAALAVHAPLTLRNLADAGHAFDTREDTDRSRRVVRRTIAFLRSHLSGAD